MIDWVARIRRLRRVLSLSQEQLANKVGVSVRTIGRWEQGKARPRGQIVLDRITELEEQARSTQGDKT